MTVKQEPLPLSVFDVFLDQSRHVRIIANIYSIHSLLITLLLFFYLSELIRISCKLCINLLKFVLIISSCLLLICSFIVIFIYSRHFVSEKTRLLLLCGMVLLILVCVWVEAG